MKSSHVRYTEGAKIINTRIWSNDGITYLLFELDNGTIVVMENPCVWNDENSWLGKVQWKDIVHNEKRNWREHPSKEDIDWYDKKYNNKEEPLNTYEHNK